MEPACLCCKQPVMEEDARLFHKVFVCVHCHDEAKRFMDAVILDLRDIQKFWVPALQHGLRAGDLDTRELGPCEDPSDRLDSLLRWIAKVKEERCQKTPETPPTSLPILSSGDSSKPHAATLRTLNRGSSDSPSSTE
jgi:hypothetical protein